MKLVYPEWEKQIVWENGRYPVVALENRACHFRIVQELSEAAAGGDTRFVLSEGEHLLDMGNICWTWDGKRPLSPARGAWTSPGAP